MYRLDIDVGRLVMIADDCCCCNDDAVGVSDAAS